MECSICIATYNKPESLAATLKSIYQQSPPFDFEVVVVDYGSPDDKTRLVCSQYPVRYHKLYRMPTYRNPAKARNAAYRMAGGEILICQSDDVVHGEDAIEQLVAEMQPGRFVVANVLNVDPVTMEPRGCGHPRNPKLVELSGPIGRRPLLFLGAVYRKDVYEIGGNDERFQAPGKEDIYFVGCLMKGLGLKPYFSTVRGYHLHHPRPPLEAVKPSDVLYARLSSGGAWRAQGAPWSYAP